MDLKKIIPHISADNAAQYGPIIDSIMDEFGITTVNRIRAFIAQIGFESGYFSKSVENLNYSSKGLLSTVPSHFNSVTAARYQHRPESIANRVYANRMGNGDELSGDGWKYRGRSGIMITGKYDYQNVSRGLGKDFIANPDLLSTPEYSLKAAAWWWRKRGLNEMADKLGVGNDHAMFDKISAAVNGGKIGLQERYSLYLNVKKCLILNIK